MLRASGRERSPLSPSIPSYCFSTEKREKKGGSSELEGKLKIDVRLYRRTGKKGKKSTINKTSKKKKTRGQDSPFPESERDKKKRA